MNIISGVGLESIIGVFSFFTGAFFASIFLESVFFISFLASTLISIVFSLETTFCLISSTLGVDFSSTTFLAIGLVGSFFTVDFLATGFLVNVFFDILFIFMI